MKLKYSVSDMLIKEINVVFIDNFLLYIKNHYGCTHNTAMKFIQRFRTVVNFAKNTGLVTADPFGNYRVKFEQTDRDYLTMEEITAIYNKKFTSKRLEQVRDLFIFSCYTALSYIDVCELTKENIRTSFDGNLWIMTKRHKTNVASNIRLLEIPKAILEKYKDNLPNGMILPIISNQKVNDYLKEIATICNINKNLTFHIARHIKIYNQQIYNNLHQQKYFQVTIKKRAVFPILLHSYSVFKERLMAQIYEKYLINCICFLIFIAFISYINCLRKKKKKINQVCCMEDSFFAKHS